MRNLLFILGLACMLNACNNSGNNSTNSQTFDINDTLVYRFYTAESVSEYKRSKSDTDKTYAKFRYPVFPIGGDTSIANRYVNKLIKNAAFNPSKHTEPVDVVQYFVMDFQDLAKKEKRSMLQHWYLDASINVIYQRMPVITFEESFSNYTGGAHGASEIHFHNFDAQQNKELALKDILNNGFESELSGIAEEIFRKQEGLSPKESLDNYFFENKEFSLTDNFAIKKEGLLFLYNQYEIKPYSEGMTELMIPYSSIQGLIRKDGPLHFAMINQ